MTHQRIPSTLLQTGLLVESKKRFSHNVNSDIDEDDFDLLSPISKKTPISKTPKKRKSQKSLNDMDDMDDMEDEDAENTLRDAGSYAFASAKKRKSLIMKYTPQKASKLSVELVQHEKNDEGDDGDNVVDEANVVDDDNNKEDDNEQAEDEDEDNEQDEDEHQEKEPPRRSARFHKAQATQETPAEEQTQKAAEKVQNSRAIAVVKDTADSESDEDELLQDEEDELLEEEDGEEEKDTEPTMNDFDDSAIASTERMFQELNSKAAPTSNNTLSKLPPLDYKEYLDIIQSLPPKQTASMSLLHEIHEGLFQQWFFELHEGFNLLFYGFGSKREILTQFALEMCTDAPLVVCNGFFPGISIRDILGKVIQVITTSSDGTGTSSNTDSLFVPSIGTNPNDQLSFITTYFQQPSPPIPLLYLLLHNIDGPNLRTEKTQSLLSLLASLKPIRFITSIDHINASLLWDNAHTTRFHFLWHDCTTYSDYTAETKNENTLMVKRAQVGGRGVQFVLASLTINARKMFTILAEHQLSEMEEEDSVNGNTNVNGNLGIGLSYHALYEKCREEFLVSNDLTFRTQLTEFRDHKIIVSKKAGDGTEVLYIPIEKKTLEGILEGLDS